MSEGARPLLKVDKLVAGYGKRQVLSDVSLDVTRGEIIAVIGHNGAGKSTLLKAIFGILPVWSGSISFDASRINGRSPRDLLRMGVAYVPQGNRVFTDLTVRENLAMAAVTLGNDAKLHDRFERVFAHFPALKSRLRQRAGTLSGGEKQMLALANTFILTPQLLLLDEPSLGLAPRLVTQALQRISQISRESSVSILIVEQKVREMLKIAHRVCALRNGRVSYFGPAEPLQNDDKLREVYF